MKDLKKDVKGIKTVKNGFVAFIASLLIIFYTATAQAHNLWIIGNADNKEDGSVHLYFEHHVGPGDGDYLGPIEKHGKTWVGISKDAWTPITMKKITEKDKKYLTGNTGKISGSYSIDHTSIYGIYHGRLDFFHGRYIEAADKKKLSEFAESPHLPVQIVPKWTEQGLLLQVMYFSTPRPRADLYLLKKDGTEQRFTTDNKGEFLLGLIQPDIYYIATHIIESDPAGAFEYQAYKGIMHVSTLTLKISDGFRK